MANLYIQEYTSLGFDGNGATGPMGHEPAETSQNVSFTTATQSAAFGETTHFVRLYGSASFHVVFGDNPTATANSMKVAANAPEYFAVEPGQKLSVYDGTT